MIVICTGTAMAGPRDSVYGGSVATPVNVTVAFCPGTVVVGVTVAPFLVMVVEMSAGTV